jgi:outer membrane protein assembly factor BamB
MSRFRSRVLCAVGVSSLLFATLGFGDTTGATSTTEPADDTATASTSPGMDETFGGWTNWRGSAARSGVADAGPTGEPVELWQVEANGGECKPPPVIAAGVVYAACAGGLIALDAAAGTERWRFEGPILDAVSVAGDLVYVNDWDPDGPPDVRTNVLRAVDAATGQERWHVTVSEGTDPVVDDGLAVVTTSDGFLVGLDAATGAERWRYQVSTEGRAGAPALADGIAYAGIAGGGMVAVDAATGTLLWLGDTGGDQPGTSVVAEGLAYAGGVGPDGEGGHLYAFDATTGELRWTFDDPLYTPAVRDGVGYSGGPVGIVTAFNTADGTERWHTQLDGAVHNTAIAGNVVYADSDNADETGATIYALDAQTGEQLWGFTVPSWVHSGLAVAGGAVYVGTEFDGVLAIGGTDQGAVAATTSP